MTAGDQKTVTLYWSATVGVSGWLSATGPSGDTYSIQAQGSLASGLGPSPSIGPIVDDQSVASTDYVFAVGPTTTTNIQVYITVTADDTGYGGTYTLPSYTLATTYALSGQGSTMSTSYDPCHSTISASVNYTCTSATIAL